MPTRERTIIPHQFDIAVDSFPTRLDSMEQVQRWHTRRVLRDSWTYEEAATRLGISKKTLWEWRKAMDIPDTDLKANYVQ